MKRGAGKVGSGRKGVAQLYLERLVSDATAPPSLRLKAAVALDRIVAREAEDKRRAEFSLFPRPAEEADL